MPRHAPAHARHTCGVTAALDESVHQIWCNRFVYSWALTRSRSVSLKRKFYCFRMFWPRNFTKNFQKFHIWNNRLFHMTFECIESAKCSSSHLIVLPLIIIVALLKSIFPNVFGFKNPNFDYEDFGCRKPWFGGIFKTQKYLRAQKCQAYATVCNMLYIGFREKWCVISTQMHMEWSKAVLGSWSYLNHSCHY